MDKVEVMNDTVKITKTSETVIDHMRIKQELQMIDRQMERLQTRKDELQQWDSAIETNKLMVTQPEEMAITN